MNEADQIISAILNIPLSKLEFIHTVTIEKDTYYAQVKKSDFTCPVCSHPSCPSNGSYSRMIKVLKSILDNFNIVLKIRRYRCPSCGYSFSESFNYHLLTKHFLCVNYQNYGIKNPPYMVDKSEKAYKKSCALVTALFHQKYSLFVDVVESSFS